jgi:hypothetical protein
MRVSFFISFPTTPTLAAESPFILRWKKDYKLIGPDGQARKAWQITRGKCSQDHREVYDCKRRCLRKTGILALPVSLPDLPVRQLWLVVSRPGKGRTPWYLLTADPIYSTEDAWRLSLLMLVAGKSKCLFVSQNPNWLLSAQDWNSAKLAKSFS